MYFAPKVFYLLFTFFISHRLEIVYISAFSPGPFLSDILEGNTAILTPSSSEGLTGGGGALVTFFVLEVPVYKS